MRRLTKNILTHSVILLLLGSVVFSVHAQQVRTLTIQEGKVYLDGEVVPADELPASLDVEALHAQYTFTGDVQPVVNLKGTLYQLDGQQLRELERPLREDDGRGTVSVFFREDLPAPRGTTDLLERENRKVQSYQFVAGKEFADRAPEVFFMEQQAQALRQQAQQFQALRVKLREQVGQRYEQEIDQHSFQLQQQAEQAAQMARELPLLEVQNYLRDVERRDRELYERLLLERQLEAQTMRLAQQIRALSESTERQQRISQLREKLEQIFEMKQENRRCEIEQLEQQLDDMESRLKEREQLRERIIDQRLEELIEVREWHDR